MEQLPISFSYAAQLTSRPLAVEKNEKSFFLLFSLFCGKCVNVMLHIMVRAKKGLLGPLSHSHFVPAFQNIPRWKKQSMKKLKLSGKAAVAFWNRGQEIMEKVIVVQSLKHSQACSLTPYVESLSLSLTHTHTHTPNIWNISLPLSPSLPISLYIYRKLIGILFLQSIFISIS